MASSELVIDTTVEPPCPVLRVAGELDAETAPVLSAQLTALIEQGHTRIILDVAEVPFIDSSGLGAIIHAARHVDAAGGCLAIARPQDRVNRLLELSRISGLVQVTETVDLARLQAVAVSGAWFEEARSQARTDELARLVTALAEAQDDLRAALDLRDWDAIAERELDFAAVALQCCDDLEAHDLPTPAGLRERATAILERQQRQAR